MSLVATPITIARYLRKLGADTRALAYLELDQSLHVIASGGNLEILGTTTINSNKSITSQVDILVGLIPTGTAPVIIANAQMVKDRFFDLHLFKELERQWVLLLDSTESARNLQADQQVRLNNALLLEQEQKSEKK